MEDETEENDEEEIMETDGEVDEPESVVEDENLLNELHMRLNHRAPSDIKKMIRDGVLSLEWTSQMEEELKDFHCEACAAVRLKNQARKERRKYPRASRPLQIIRMDTVPCPENTEEADEFQKLLQRLPKRSVATPPDYKHVLLLVDEFTRMKWSFPLFSKSAEDVARVIEKWVAEEVPMISSRIVRNDPSFDRSIENLLVELNSDDGKEFSTGENVQAFEDNAFLTLVKQLKVAHHVSAPDQQWQNGVVEGQVGVLKENAIISLRVAQAGIEFFPMAFNLAVDNSNRLPVDFGGKLMSPYERMFGQKPEIKILPMFLQMVQYKVGGGGKASNGSRAMKGYFLGLKENKPGSHGILVYNPTSKRTVVRQNYKVIPLRYEIMWSPPLVNVAALNAAISSRPATGLDFSEADAKEIQGIVDNGTFGPVVVPDTSKCDVVDTKMVREMKKDGTLKSRLVARGFSQQEGKSFFQTFVATPMVETIMISLAVSVQMSWTPFAADCTRAFLQPEVPDYLKGLLCIKLPKDLNLGPDSEYQGGQIRELKKLIYGCKQSGRIWQQFVTDTMLGYDGAAQSSKDLSTFFLRCDGNLLGIVIIMIDDILCLSEQKTWDNLFKYLQTKLAITGGDVAKVWNGYEIEKLSDGSLSVSQSKQISETLKRLELGAGPVISRTLLKI